MNPEQRRLEKTYRLELGRLHRLLRKKDFTAQGEFQFNRQLEITTAAKDALLKYQAEQYALR